VRAYDAGRWLLLATLWSLQFIFMRVAVPVFGSGPVAEARALFAALFLAPWVIFFARQRIAPLAHWKDHLAVGLVNNVLPFAFFAWAATVLPSSYLALISGLVSPWAALFAAWVLHEPLGARRLGGFVLGMAGVALLVDLGPIEMDARAAAAAAAGVTGAALWGWAGVMIKQRSGRLPPMSLAAGSIAFSAALMAPLWAVAPPPAAWTPHATAALIALGLLCSGLAYLPFFTLIRDIGPSRTLAVGFLVPVLGVAWGWLLLGEPVTLAMVAGGALVIAGMALVLRK
jgi:drug/metabolite transporter (DMT)-like permease